MFSMLATSLENCNMLGMLLAEDFSKHEMQTMILISVCKKAQRQICFLGRTQKDQNGTGALRSF